MDLTFRVAGKIEKPLAEVFDAVHSPEKLTRYFCDASSGFLDAGTSVSWTFAQPNGSLDMPVRIKECITNERLVFEWPSNTHGIDTEVIMEFSELGPSTTLVEIRESGWPDSESGLASSYENCSGWTHMLCSLKAWIESGADIKQFYNEPC